MAPGSSIQPAELVHPRQPDRPGQAGVGQPGAEEVPLSGGTPILIGAEPHTLTITTAGSQIVAGLSRDRLVTLSGPAGSWQLLGRGQDPAYPG